MERHREQFRDDVFEPILLSVRVRAREGGRERERGRPERFFGPYVEP